MILGDPWWSLVILGDPWRSLVILGDPWWSLEILDDPWWSQVDLKLIPSWSQADVLPGNTITGYLPFWSNYFISAKIRIKARGPQHHNGKIASYHCKICGNISLNRGISWGLTAPRPPRGFPRVLGHGSSDWSLDLIRESIHVPLEVVFNRGSS